jgi:acetylglutamate kinase
MTPQFVEDGLRVTDAETLEIVRMVLVGKVNRDIVSRDQRPCARWPSASRGRTPASSPPSSATPQLGFVGDVVRRRPHLGRRPPHRGAGSGDRDDRHPTRSGQAYNINADTVAGAIAETLEAEKLVFLTDVEGIRSEAADPKTLLHQLRAAELDAMVASGAVAEGMVPKATACAHAVRHGVRSAHVLDGRVAHAILLELLTSEGVGTMVVA